MRTLFGPVSVPIRIVGGTAAQNKPEAPAMPLKPVGDNTLVVTMNGENGPSVTMNGQDATDLFIGKRGTGISRLKPSAMLMNGIEIDNDVTQLPHNKGDWFAVKAFKVEQLRPPLENSSEAAVDLTVPGSEPVTVTIEVVDAWNDSKGYVLRDAVVAPGKYRLYWDGIDQNNIAAQNTAWIGSGSYTFRMTTSKTAVHYVGEINNSAPKYTTTPYELVNATALAMTPPGTALPSERSPKNNASDTVKLDAIDSVQMLTAPSDANHGQWIAANGAVISTETASVPMTHGRGLAITPPDPSDPTNLEKQYYFATQNGRGDVISAPLANGADKRTPKTLTSPDWNRTKPGFVPYEIQLGQIPGGATLGPQHELIFRAGVPQEGGKLQAEWVFRNIRFYEEGSPDPGPTTFDPAKFSVRTGAPKTLPLHHRSPHQDQRDGPSDSPEASATFQARSCRNRDGGRQRPRRPSQERALRQLSLRLQHHPENHHGL